jgi:hypothetical protein
LFFEAPHSPGEQPPGAQLPSFSLWLAAGFAISVALTPEFAALGAAAGSRGFSAVAWASVF